MKAEVAEDGSLLELSILTRYNSNGCFQYHTWVSVRLYSANIQYNITCQLSHSLKSSFWRYRSIAPCNRLPLGVATDNPHNVLDFRAEFNFLEILAGSNIKLALKLSKGVKSVCVCLYGLYQCITGCRDAYSGGIFHLTVCHFKTVL